MSDQSWYCSKDCKTSHERHQHTKPGKALQKKRKEVDHVKKYACSLVWQGLFHRARRDAERENDGMAMNAHWRIDSVNFWNKNHFKYLILSHRLTAGKKIYF